MKKVHHFRTSQSGFTLLEIVLSLGMILILSLALTSMITSSIELKRDIGASTNMTRAMGRAMQTLIQDLEHTFYIPKNDFKRIGDRLRQMNTVFKIESRFDFSKVIATTLVNRPLRVKDRFSEMALVQYEVDQERKVLLRRVAQRIPVELDQPLEDEQVLLENVTRFSIQPWRGDQWMQDGWDTNRGESRDKLPRRVRIEIGAVVPFGDPLEEGAEEVEGESQYMVSAAFLQHGTEYKEIRQATSTIRWGEL